MATCLCVRYLNKILCRTKKKKTPTALLKNDPKTENTTDPQDHMEGLLSSIMQKGKEKINDNDDKDKDEGKQ